MLRLMVRCHLSTNCCNPKCGQGTHFYASAAQGLWGALGKIPLQLPRQVPYSHTAIGLQQQTQKLQQQQPQQQQHVFAPSKYNVSEQDRQPANPFQHLPGTLPPKPSATATVVAAAAAMQEHRSHATRPVPRWQHQEGTELPVAQQGSLQHDPAQQDSTQPEAQPHGSCPQVQFGVFTNLTSGNTFAKPGKLSKAAQQKVQELATSFRQDGMLEQGSHTTFMQHAALNDGYEDQNTVGAQAHHADTQQGLGHLADMTHDLPSEKPWSAAPTTVKHRSGQATGVCPRVQFGVFTNLTSGNSFTKPGKLSTAAQQKMQQLAADLRQEGMLEHGPDAAKMQQLAEDQPWKAQTVAHGQALHAEVRPEAEGMQHSLPSKSSVVAQRQPASASHSDVSAQVKAIPALIAQPSHEHREAEPLVESGERCSVQPPGACPQVQLGVFTNLTTGSSFTKPGKLSKGAHQKAQELSASFRQEGLLEQAPGLDDMQHSAQAEVKQDQGHAAYQAQQKTDTMPLTSHDIVPVMPTAGAQSPIQDRPSNHAAALGEAGPNSDLPQQQTQPNAADMQTQLETGSSVLGPEDESLLKTQCVMDKQQPEGVSGTPDCLAPLSCIQALTYHVTTASITVPSHVGS